MQQKNAEPASSKKPRGRPHLRSPEEVRAASIAGGIKVLTASGLEIGMRGVTIEAAAKAAGIPRASIYRVWKRESPESPGPQQEFQVAVAVEILSNFVIEQAGVFDAVLDVMSEVTGRSEPLEIAAAIGEMTDAQRRNAFARTLAAGTLANIASLHNNSLFHTQAGLLASINSQGEPPRPMVEAMLNGEALGEVRWVELYEFIFATFGMRMKAHYRYEHLALAGVALSTGLGQRQFSAHLNKIDRPVADPSTGELVPDGTEWNLFGVSSMGLISEFCEADDCSPFPTDPRLC